MTGIKTRAPDARPSNDAMLPMAQRSTEAKMLELYSRHGSWVICEHCHSLRPKAFKAMDMKREPPAEISKCNYCEAHDKAKATHAAKIKSGVKFKGKAGKPSSAHVPYVPQPEDVPQSLRQLTPAIIKALRPLDIDVGPYERNKQGYRVHTSMIRFAWSKHDVERKISGLLKKRDRKKAKAAYRRALSWVRKFWFVWPYVGGAPLSTTIA